MISDPRPTPQAHMADWIAAVPLLKPRAYLASCHTLKSSSNLWVTSVPDMAPRRKTSSTASSSSWVMIGQVNISPGSLVTALGPPKRASWAADILFHSYLTVCRIDTAMVIDWQA